MKGDLRIDGCRIDGSASVLHVRAGTIVPEADGPVVEADGLLAVPGYIDLQINGGFGHDFTRDPQSIWEVGARLPRHGVTSFLPTIITSPPSVVAEARAVVAAGPPTGYVGAVPLGLHCEGPMLSPIRRGAHTMALLTAADSVPAGWGGLGGIRMVTLAPEIEGAEELIPDLVERGVVVSLGHSDCSAAVGLRALRAGARCGTHLFNAMSGLDHRRPGLAAALLTHPDATVGVIADGIHVDPGMVELAYRLAGRRLLLVTDAMAAMCQGEGSFQLGGVEVMVEGARATTAGGVLAGSVLTMDEAVRNLAAFTGCSIEAATAHATATPARLMDEDNRGSLAPGAVGDVVLLDEAGHVVVTVIDGTVVEDRR